MIDPLEMMQLANESLKAHIADLQAKLRAPWHDAIRTELAKREYADAVAAKDAAAVFALLSAPGDTVLLDPIPVEHVRAVLSAISPTAAGSNNTAWLKIVDQQTALLVGVTEIPRARVEPLRHAAVGSGVLPADYQIGAVALSALQRIGSADIVTHAEHVALAMGWGE